MRLFRVMAQAQEEIMRSPFTDLLLEMAVVRMATLAPVLDSDELMRAISAAEKSTPPASGSSSREPASSQPAPARRIKVAGEVKADAPLKDDLAQAPASEPAADLPELRDFIRQRKAALAGFMEHGAALRLEGDVLQLTPRSDIYVRYLTDNRSTIAQLATELYGRSISVSIRQTSPGASPHPATTTPLAERVVTAPIRSEQAPAAENGKLSAMVETTPAAARANGAEREAAKKALYDDPVAKRIFEEFQGRLVDIKEGPPSKSPDRR